MAKLHCFRAQRRAPRVREPSRLAPRPECGAELTNAMCINYAFVCGVKSDDDFLRVRHEKEGQKANAKKERENKRTTEQRKERIF